MIHSDTIKGLTEDERVLLYAVGGFIYQRSGLSHFKPEWVQMVKVVKMVEVLNNIANLKEEYIPVRDSLVVKLKESGDI